jgi:hypothetical protein
LNEIPAGFLERLDRLFGEWRPDRPQGLRRVRLAGLDREEARQIIGLDRFEHVCRLIRESRLAELASLPIVLEHLRQKEIESLTQEEVWRGVLEGLLRDKRGRERPFEIEDCFGVVQRIAAVLTFSGRRGLGIDAPGPRSPDLETLLPPNQPEFRILRQAAREAVRTAVFERTEDGFRFAQDHVREWFAAFALREMSLVRVHPLLTDESGAPNPLHRGLMGILAWISPNREVRDWIVEAHGGVAPPSDAAPWSLEQAIQALDRLQDLARSSAWGLDLWREERLGHFAVPGMGPEIARRLDLPLQPREQQLLLDLARAIGAPEAVQTAVRLLQEPSQDERVRVLAAELLDQLGAEEDLEPLSQWARSMERAPEDSALATLVSCFYRKGVWDLQAAAEFALARTGFESEWLQHLLASDLSLEQARWLVGAHLVPAPRLFFQPLLEGALQRIIRQEPLGELDRALLVPLVLCEEIEHGHIGLHHDLLRAFRRDLVSRRELFLEGMRTDPDSRKDGSWRWRHVLAAEDLEWLIELVRDRQGQSAWLLETLYFLSCRREVSRRQRSRARAEIRARNAGLLHELDRQHRKERRRQARWNQQRPQTYELEPLVRDSLDDPELDLRRRMWRLSWSFTKQDLRPPNVSGRWEDLPEDLRGKVLSVCREALVECLPTPIPGGSSFPQLHPLGGGLLPPDRERG